MKFKVSQTALALFFGAALIAAPAVFGAKGPLAYDQAFAGPGKSGDHGKGNGNGGGKGKKAAAAEEVEEEELKNKKGKLASKLGALNAYHASLNAFEHASPNSRVGRIKAYWDALEAAEKDGLVDADEQAELDKLLDDAGNKILDAETKEAFNDLLREKFAGEDDEGEEETTE